MVHNTDEDGGQAQPGRIQVGLLGGHVRVRAEVADEVTQQDGLDDLRHLLQ